MTSLLAARREHFAATFSLHARTESVSLGAASFPRLKCTLRQSIPPYWCLRCPSFRNYKGLFARRLLAWMAWGLFLRAFLTHPWQLSELSSVLAARAQGQENRGVSYREGKSDTPPASRRLFPLSRFYPTFPTAILHELARHKVRTTIQPSCKTAQANEGLPLPQHEGQGICAEARRCIGRCRLQTLALRGRY